MLISWWLRSLCQLPRGKFFQSPSVVNVRTYKFSTTEPLYRSYESRRPLKFHYKSYFWLLHSGSRNFNWNHQSKLCMRESTPLNCSIRQFHCAQHHMQIGISKNGDYLDVVVEESNDDTAKNTVVIKSPVNIQSETGRDVQNKHMESVDVELDHSSSDSDSDKLELSSSADLEEYEEYYEDDNEVIEVIHEQIHPIALQRGVEGVFDIGEVVTVLRAENGQDICTIRVPKSRNYVDYLVIVTGRSRRHLVAMAEYIKSLYKKKRCNYDAESVHIEGKTTDWLALDLGNIAVHLFQSKQRHLYDLETLWTVGEDYDDNIARDSDDNKEYAFLFDSVQQHSESSAEEQHSESSAEEQHSESTLPTDSLHPPEKEVITSFSSHSDKWHQSSN